MKTKAAVARCGIDEAGRGALAGPIVAAAVMLPCSPTKVSKIAQTPLKDGKLLTPSKRRRVCQALKQLNATICVEVISTRSINNHGIGWANKEVIRRLIQKIDADEYIVDGNLRLGRIMGKTDHIKSVVDADATIPQVICAGIIAKVERDKLMRNLHKQFPKYKWKLNAGYGTKKHLEAIKLYDMTYYHRRIFVTTALRKRS